MVAVDAPRARTYGNWRKPVSPGLMGLGSVGTGLMIGGLVFAVLLVMTRGLGVGIGFLVVVGGAIVIVQTRDQHHRNLAQRVGARLGWWSTRATGANLYRSGPLGCTHLGSFQIPGIGGATTLSEHRDSWGRLFALVWHPRAGYTVVLGSDPDGAALVDAQQIDLWVASWGHWLRQLGEEPDLTGATVTIETAPDTGHRLRREIDRAIDPDANPFSVRVLNQVVGSYPVGSSTVRAYVAVTFSGKQAGKRRPAEEMARELGARLPGLTGSLQATGAGAAAPLSAAELCEVVRIAYDPASATAIEEARAEGEIPDVSWTDVGPTAAEATWDTYRHDSGISQTWAMTGAPRGVVQASVLTRLLEPNSAVARKRVTLLFRPIDPARAAALVEADVRAAQFTATSHNRAQARDTYALRSATATAAEEAAGAGLVDFGMLVTATVTDPASARDSQAAVANLAGATRVRLRLVQGSQDSAFAAALPLGLSLASFSTVPTAFREKL